MRVYHYVFGGIVAMSLGCADRTPARIDISTSTQTLYDDQAHPLGARLVDVDGQVLAEPALTYSATPAGVVEVNPAGLVTCQRSGDASIVAAGGGQSAAVAVTCRLVKEIRAPERVRLVLGRDPETLAFSATDEAGRNLQGIPLQVSFSPTGIAGFAGGKLTAAAVGNTTVSVVAGRASASFPLSVVELVRSEPLALNDGASTTLTLQQGRYDLDLQVSADNGSTNGVTVTWTGADCPAEREAQNHALTCDVRATAGLTIANPTAFGLGPGVTGFLNLYRAAR